MMDDLDRRLLAALAGDARQSSMELSRKLGVSETTVRRRIHRLQGQGIVTFVAVPDAAKLGYGVMAIIGLEINLESLDQVAESLANCPNVHYVAICTGHHDILFGVSFHSHHELIEFVKNHLAKMPGIRKSETFVVLDVRKSEAGWLQRLEQGDTALDTSSAKVEHWGRPLSPR